ncbi:hypothetical protein GCM10007175_23310 [Pseudarthrobacter scleromae]|uniref:Suppressor of fused-like domain-containing protein n=1 Tax=Pseudarthrobacter scleromae TaxID=158897 RepID=A0ABQ2CF85_9MICC|nr:hypothetical protein GCM10007175_23310 [Pseudarthrobacter scleromae]
MSLGEELDAHYRAHVGPDPIRWGNRETWPPPVSLHEWNASSNRMGVHFYATYGMSLAALRGSVSHGVELYSGVDQKSDELRDAMAALASNARDSGTIFRDCEILDAQAAVIPGRTFTGWIFFDRSDQVLPDLALSNGCHIKYLDIAPVFPEEVEYSRANGVDALLELWNSEGTEVWVHTRPVPHALVSEHP